MMAPRLPSTRSGVIAAATVAYSAAAAAAAANKPTRRRNQDELMAGASLPKAANARNRFSLFTDAEDGTNYFSKRAASSDPFVALPAL